MNASYTHASRGSGRCRHCQGTGTVKCDITDFTESLHELSRDSRLPDLQRDRASLRGNYPRPLSKLLAGLIPPGSAWESDPKGTEDTIKLGGHQCGRREIRTRATIMRRRRWRRDEITAVVGRYSAEGPGKLAHELGRSVNAVSSLARRYGQKTPRRNYVRVHRDIAYSEILGDTEAP